MTRCTVTRLCPEMQPPVAATLGPCPEIGLSLPAGGEPDHSACSRELSAAALAHDLRSSLNAILLSTEAVRLRIRPEDPLELRSFTDRIDRNVRMALGMIGLTELGLSVAAVRLDELARETAEAMQPITDNAGVRIKLRLDPVCVRGDRIRLGRVVSNLLGNAIRHSPRGGSIDLIVTQQESTAMCHVADQGPGVPPRDRNRIFEPHFQGSSMPGTAGLGLFICRRIVEVHGGRIWVEDHLPQGAHFIFTLPLAERPLNTQPGCSRPSAVLNPTRQLPA
jgi:signal transduction histidine kinase